jgi:hypothetical protein
MSDLVYFEYALSTKTGTGVATIRLVGQSSVELPSVSAAGLPCTLLLLPACSQTAPIGLEAPPNLVRIYFRLS